MYFVGVCCLQQIVVLAKNVLVLPMCRIIGCGVVCWVGFRLRARTCSCRDENRFRGNLFIYARARAYDEHSINRERKLWQWLNDRAHMLSPANMSSVQRFSVRLSLSHTLPSAVAGRCCGRCRLYSCAICVWMNSYRFRNNETQIVHQQIAFISNAIKNSEHVLIADDMY